MTSNITLTDSNNNMVTIAGTLPEEIIMNKLGKIPMPKTRKTESEGLAMKIVNLMRITRTFTFDGYLAAGGDSSDFSGSDTAKQQRTKLRNMAMSTRNVNMVYDDVSESVAIEKLSIKENPGGPDTPEDFDIKITVVQGTNVLG